MPANDESKPPIEWLQHLYDAQQWNRLIEVGARALAADPHDTAVHCLMGWAYFHTDRLEAMRRHVEFLLQAEPNEERSHHLAAIHCLESETPKMAKGHVDFLLREDPENPNYHYLACLVALRLNHPDAARHHIEQARRHAPDWAAAAHLEIQMDGVRQQRASEAWHRIHRLEEALANEPNHTGIMRTIGEIHLRELEQPREAEQLFRRALAIDPTCKETQARLFDAIRASSLLYRTLSLPVLFVRHIRERSLSLLFCIIFIKVVVGFLVWLIGVGLLFTPAAWVYERLVLTGVAGTSRLAPLRALARLPFWIRLALALAVIVSLWTLAFCWMFTLKPMRALQWIGWLFGAHFVVVCVAVSVARLRTRLGRWQENRRQRREARHASVPAA